jgi:hypothetical protein
VSTSATDFCLDLDLPTLMESIPDRDPPWVSIAVAEANFRPLIDATRDKWPTQEERLRNKNPEPFVMD